MRYKRAATLLEVVIATALTLALVTAMVQWSQVLQTLASAGSARVEASRTAAIVSTRLGTDFEKASGCDTLRRGRSVASVSTANLVLLGEVTGDEFVDRVAWQIVGTRITRTVEPGTGGCTFGTATATVVVTDRVKPLAVAKFSLLANGVASDLSGTLDCVLTPGDCSFDAIRLTALFLGADGATIRFSDSFPIDASAFVVGGQIGASGPQAGFSVPSAPTAVTGLGGPGLVTVSWRPPSSGGGALVESYEIRVLSSNNSTPLGVSGAIQRTMTRPPFTFAGLSAGIMYTFQVRAISSVGAGSWSSPSAPVAPSGASVTTGITGFSNIAAAIGTAIAQNGAPNGGSAPFVWSSSPTMGHSLTLSATTGSLTGTLGGGVRAVVGSSSPCALLADGGVTCWGFNSSGQLGVGDTVSTGGLPGQMGAALRRVDFGAGLTAVELAAGAAHTCAVLSDGSVTCWGANGEGELGLGNTVSRGSIAGQMGANLQLVTFGTGRKALSIAAGDKHTCAILDDHSVKCWGLNDFGQLGLGDTVSRGDNTNEMGDSLPIVALGVARTAKAIAVGGRVSCAVLDNNTAKCWGQNGKGQLGQGDTSNRGDNTNELGDALPPIAFGALRSVQALVVAPGNVSPAGTSHVCALLDNSSVKCFGSNNAGQLGLGDTANRGDGPNEMGDMLPSVALGSLVTASKLGSSGVSSTCVVLSNAATKCWGLNSSGELGLGDTANRGGAPGEMGDFLPATLLPAGVETLSRGGSGASTCAVLTTSQVVCWGSNVFGQLGVGSTTSKGDGPNEMGAVLQLAALGDVTATYVVSVRDAAGVQAQIQVTVTSIS